MKGYAPVLELPCLQSPNAVPKATSVHTSRENTIAFTFTNLKVEFKEAEVDWNYAGHGALWVYNLNYFDFLFSPDLNLEQKKGLIEQYCTSFDRLSYGLEPYPVSMRCMNWIKFFSLNDLNNERFNEYLFRQYRVLCANLEYHLLGNHLLENAFSLLFGAYYFRNEQFYDKAKKLLIEQLAEQVLQDGGHFERSPMYHQLILYRLMECYDLVTSNDWKEDEVEGLIRSNAEKMLGWLKNMSFSNGDVPMMKDSAPDIAPANEVLEPFASRLGLSAKSSIELKDSGYRKLQSSKLELIADVGSVNPSYQPGHAHADELNFHLFANGTPLIVEAGTSTYNASERRMYERSTSAHNSPSLGGRNSTEVWGGFRVAFRARVKITTDETDDLCAQHDGFKKHGILMQRRFRKTQEGFELEDSIEGTIKNGEEVSSHLHFYPGITPEINDSRIDLENVRISLQGFKEAKTETYMFATGFNDLRVAHRISLVHDNKTKIRIEYAG